MYKKKSLKPYFIDFFSRKNYIKQRKRKTKTLVSQNKTKTHERFSLELNCYSTKQRQSLIVLLA